jgi:hypothetical protein
MAIEYGLQLGGRIRALAGELRGACRAAVPVVGKKRKYRCYTARMHPALRPEPTSTKGLPMQLEPNRVSFRNWERRASLRAGGKYATQWMRNLKREA